jgi:mono/diheme cytochrome c family protein
MQFRLVVAGLLAGLCGAVAVATPFTSAGQSTEESWLAGGDPKRGEQVFASNGCGWCHEGTGRKPGKGPQLMNSKHSDEFLAERIMNGKQGAMPAFGGNFDEDQLKDLIAFIRSLKPEGAS